MCSGGRRGTRRLAVLLPALLPVLLLGGSHVAAANEGGSPLFKQFQARFVGKPAPAFALKDMNGRTVRLADEHGKVLLLNFWYSSCPPCRKETPELATLHRLYQARGFEVLGINLDRILIPQSTGAELQRFVKEFSLPYPVLVADPKVFEAYGSVPVQPISFLVDRGGMVARLFWGAFPGAYLERAIAPYLRDPGSPAGPEPARP